jgi:4-diphosphocytidyl-2-C-methyl-D-erythritol kinase
MRVRAPAKINLSLRVVGIRPDGYHELRTVFQSIDLHDELTIHRTNRALEMTCDDPACPSGGANLVWRAAEAVWKATGRSGRPRGVALHLVKRIPMQAGLGGGSSDAAAAVRALGRLWGVARPRQRAIAISLGADVPFFLEGGMALGLDRGDLLFPLPDRPREWVVLALPRIGVSTRDAFRWFDAGGLHDRRRKVRLLENVDWGNDLEHVVAKHHPEVAAISRTLGRAGASPALMSGSGSAVFGLFVQRHAAVAAAERVEARFPRTRTVLSRTVGRAAYHRLAGT